MKINREVSPLTSQATLTFVPLSFIVASTGSLSFGAGKYFDANSRIVFAPTPLVAANANAGINPPFTIAVFNPRCSSSSLSDPSSKNLFISSSLDSATFSTNSSLNLSALAFISPGISSSVTFLEPASPYVTIFIFVRSTTDIKFSPSTTGKDTGITSGLNRFLAI